MCVCVCVRLVNLPTSFGDLNCGQFDFIANVKTPLSIMYDWVAAATRKHQTIKSTLNNASVSSFITIKHTNSITTLRLVINCSLE